MITSFVLRLPNLSLLMKFLTLITKNSLGHVFHSEPLIFIIQVLCFYKFTNSFYKVTESQMRFT